MMRLIFTSLLFFAVALSSQAQERVRNVRIRVMDSSQLEIRYDLINARPGDSLYFEVRSRLRGSLRISPEFIRGDLGTRITAGSDKRIIWNAVANGYPLNEEIQAKVLVKTGVFATDDQPVTAAATVAQKPAPTESKPETVPPKSRQKATVTIAEPKSAAPAPVSPTNKATPQKPSIFAADPSSTESAPAVAPKPEPQPARTSPAPAGPAVSPVDSLKPRKVRYAGPAWALVSAVAPGIGNIFVQTPKPKIGLRPLVTVGTYGLLIYGFMERKKAQDQYAIYEQQKNRTAGEPYYKLANDHHHAYFLATRGALVVAAADVVLTFIKGLRNSQLQKEARRFQSVTIRPGLQAGQPTALVRYSF